MDDEKKRREAIKRLFALRTAEITRTPETARAALIEEGIYDKDGNLTAEYGGESADPKAVVEYTVEKTRCPTHLQKEGKHTSNDESDYLKYRGKCKEMAETAVAAEPALTLVRGHYYCPIWGEQPHWWCKKPDGTIVDPTKSQFPSRGIGEYVEFDGTVTCANCGKEMREEDADIDGNYAFCSYECHGRFVGVF